MTVCITAAYKDSEEKYGIVLCCDWRVETDQASSETVDKLGCIKVGWPVLISESISDSDSLIQSYVDNLRSVVLTDDNVQNQMELATEYRKESIVKHHLAMKHVMTLEVFRRDGPTALGPTLYHKTEAEITKLNLRSYLLISGFIDDAPYIFKVQPDGQVIGYDNCAAIGSGYELAESWLHWREHEDDATLTDTVHNVYEAKRFAEMDGGVGAKFTSMYVLKPSGQVFSVKKTAREKLRNDYEEFRSKRFRTLSDDLLEEEPEEFTI